MVPAIAVFRLEILRAQEPAGIHLLQKSRRSVCAAVFVTRFWLRRLGSSANRHAPISLATFLQYWRWRLRWEILRTMATPAIITTPDTATFLANPARLKASSDRTPISRGMFGISLRRTSSTSPSTTFTRSANISISQCAHSASLYRKAARLMTPLNPDGGVDVPKTAGRLANSTDCRTSTLSLCCAGRCQSAPSLLSFDMSRIG